MTSHAFVWICHLRYFTEEPPDSVARREMKGEKIGSAKYTKRYTIRVGDLCIEGNTRWKAQLSDTKMSSETRIARMKYSMQRDLPGGLDCCFSKIRQVEIAKPMNEFIIDLIVVF